MYSSSHQRMLHSRNIITWLILTIIVIYFLYSTNLLYDNDQPDCSISTATHQQQQHLLIRTTTNNTSSSASKVEESIEEKEDKKIDDRLQHKEHEDDDDDDDDEEKTNGEEGNNSPVVVHLTPQQMSQRKETELKHIVFGIAASSNLWNTRKEYIKIWWRPKETRGVVWLDQKVPTQSNEQLPEIKISSDTSKFKYTNRQGQRSALRISRVVTETLKLGMEDVRWFVMGDDDTVFMVDNVVNVLNKYDHRHFYYVGSSSESHVQNIHFSYSMAYGGGGFAISYPLAKELAKMQDRCIQRYPALYGSDDRMQACMAELGVPLTKEPGFHQYDVYGDLLGLLGAHPVTPLVSLHHLDVVEPIFPRMTRVRSLRHLMESVNQDSASIMQQSICYDKNRYWSISISWGYVVQILRGVMSPRELEMPSRTFLNWYKRADYTAYAFNTRPVYKHPCEKPFVYYMSRTHYDSTKKQTIGVYLRDKYSKSPFCRWRMESPDKITSIVVMKRPDPLRWKMSPRKDCCRIMPSHKGSSTMYLMVENCRDGEVTEL
ncbi:hypothetical protein Lal_00045670 [Lupinus albus]|uniref:Putative WD40/YVTN repeat-like-containing domain-containing protein n=1 Tax=Lupinus albus TaxID=3870 RepID=A0A6A5NNU9_LUPAL|nr:putative WD40/YVTN repeat-like-containing domain-containing protein [Lupinus albus]KAF1886438.1 hypothetical protein Lal_00045670 [Lupinus albus]